MSRKVIGMEKNPTVSVLMPVYNEEPEHLQQAIKSISNQSFTDLELLLWNDGSEFESNREILDEAQRSDDRIRVFDEVHRGVPRSRNLGFGYCRGEILCPHDADDWSEPNRLEEQVVFLENHPDIALVGSYVMLHQNDGAKLWEVSYPCEPEETLATFRFEYPFAHGSACIRKSVAESVGGYCEYFEICHDYDFFWRICERYGGANIPEVFYHHRRAGNTLTARNSYQTACERTVIRHLALQRRFDRTEDPQEMFRRVESELPPENSEIWTFDIADQFLLGGEWTKALRLNLQALKSKPLSRTGYLKLIRLFLFVCIPGLRKSLFGIPKFWVRRNRSTLGIRSSQSNRS